LKLSSLNTTTVLLNDIKVMTPTEAKNLLFKNIYYNEYKVPQILNALNVHEDDFSDNPRLSEPIGGLNEGVLRTLVNDNDWQSIHLDFMNDIQKFFFLHKSGKIPDVFEFAQTFERSPFNFGNFLTRHFQ